MIKNCAVRSGKADAETKEGRSEIESFLPAPGFSAVVRLGKIGRCSANFQFRQRQWGIPSQEVS